MYYENDKTNKEMKRDWKKTLVEGGYKRADDFIEEAGVQGYTPRDILAATGVTLAMMEVDELEFAVRLLRQMEMQKEVNND